MDIKSIGTLPMDNELKQYLNQGNIPVKFCYPKEGGNKWHKLRQNKYYTLGNRELKAFRNGLNKLSDFLNLPTNIVHLGPGDGIEIPIILKNFNLDNDAKYAGVDISKQMIYNTYEFAKSYFQKTKPLWYFTDIETNGNLELVCADVKVEGVDRNLILLSNQGVLFSNPKTLQNVYNSMQKEDYLFITIEGDDPEKRDEILATYNLPDVKNLLFEGLNRAGYNTKDGVFKFAFNDLESLAEVYFEPKNEPKILCLTSYKPTEKGFEKKLVKRGFNIRFLEFYKKVHSFAVLCTK